MDRFAFLLNLADDGRPEPAQALSAGAASKVRKAAEALAVHLVPAGSVVLHDAHAPVEGRDLQELAGLRGRAFLPHAAARARLAALGAVPDPAPDDAVLARVLVRSFAYADASGEGSVTADAEATVAAVSRLLGAGHAVRVKAAYGHAGRGQLVVSRPLDAPTVMALRRLGPGTIVEPERRILRELSVHGHLSARGVLVVGVPCEVTTAHGAFVAAQRLDPSSEPTLVATGFFGPFGLDAYEYEARDGRALRARSEVNARYTMAYPVGMGARRPDLEPL